MPEQQTSKKGVFWGVIVVILVVIAVTYFSQKSSEDTIKIGYFGPFSGPVAASTGADIGNGFKLAYAKNHTINGKKVEVIYEDDGCDPKKAVAAATKLLNVDKVKVLVSGVCSGSTLSAAPLAEKAKAILFTPVSTTPKLTTAGDYVFRTSASGVVTADAMIQTAKDLGYKNIAILFESAEYPTGIKDALLKKFPEVAGNKIVAIEGFAPNETDLRSPLLKLSQAKPDAFIFIVNSNGTALSALKQKTALQIKTPIMGNEYFIQREVIVNPDAEGVLTSTYKYDVNSIEMKDLISEYMETYPTPPSQDLYVALAYDGYNVLFGAMEKCGGADPECIKQELYKVQNYQGISGVISIDENGDTKREFVMKKVVGGKVVDIK